MSLRLFRSRPGAWISKAARGRDRGLRPAIQDWNACEAMDGPGRLRRLSNDPPLFPFDQRSWEKTVADMKEGKVDFVTKPQELHPDRYGLRYERASATEFTPQQLEEVRGGGWTLESLQEKVDQFVLHFDVCGTSAQCFYILHDKRGLSVHFMLDVDGTIYQTLDLKERAWHSTKANDRSIGIEIANIGAYRPDSRDNPFAKWYRTNADGQAQLIFPENIKGRDLLLSKTLRSRKAEPVKGSIHGRDYVQYDYTPEQYEALIKLSAALSDIFPKLKPDAPRTPEGNIIDRTLSDEQWASFSGILGHYHVQSTRRTRAPLWIGTIYSKECAVKRLKSKQREISA